MKKALIFVPIVISLVILGAHFMRYGNLIGVLGSLALIGLLLVDRPWVARLMQIVLLLGSLEWVRTIYALAQERIARGESFARMVVILGIVAAIAFCSALLFQTATLKRFYRLDRRA